MQKIKTLKNNTKKKIKRYKEQSPEKVALYLQEIYDIPKEKIVYVDETGIDTCLYREYCYAKRGEKVIGYVYGRKYSRVGIVAAQRGKKILSPFQYKGTMNSKLFERWFENNLLRSIPSESIIVMDNAAFHRKRQLTLLAENNGHRIIFLPPYSPELNPIEHFWAFLKQKLKKCLHNFSNFDDALHYCFNCN